MINVCEFRLLYIRGTKAQNDTALAMVKQIAGGHALETSITEVDLDLSDQIDFTIPARYAEDAIRGIDGTYKTFIYLVKYLYYE